jgi:hypothetical protein
MSETKTATAAPKMPKIPGAETFQDASKKAFMAYLEAGAELGVQFDRLARFQAAHATAISREASEVLTATIESGLKARETMRKAAVDVIEGSLKN